MIETISENPDTPPVAERLAAKHYDLGLSRLGFKEPSACEANALTHCATAAVILQRKIISVYWVIFADCFTPVNSFALF